jgi:hypothetical protein
LRDLVGRKIVTDLDADGIAGLNCDLEAIGE